MAKDRRISLPVSQGGLLGGFNEALKTKIMFSPKLVVYFAIFLIVLEVILHNM